MMIGFFASVTLKRSVAGLMILVMLCSMMPMTVLASESVETEGNLWNGRSAVFVGDSITAGGSTTKIYYQYLNEALGFSSVTPMGVNGSCISAASDYGQSKQPLINRYQNIPSADLIMIFMGTNDYGHETPLGSEEDTEDGTFYGALNVIIPALVEKHPSSKIVFVTPLHRYGFGTSKILGTQFTSDSVANGVGAALDDYVEALKTVCANNGVSVIDLYTECTLDPADAEIRTNYMPDGLHPNAAGHEVIAGIMESHIRGFEPAEQEPVELTEMVYGNRFAAGNNQTCRASSRINYYLKAGTVITLKDSATMQWACAKTSNENSSNNLGYFPDSAWTDKETAVVENDGWVGFVFKYRDETEVFDLTKPLSDYITIEAPHTHREAVDAAKAPTCTETGLTEGTHCETCGEILVTQEVVSATGHTYENGICSACDAVHTNLANYKGKVISILGDSISTFAGYIPTADGFNLEHYARYPQDNLFTDVEHTWWMQVLTALDARLGINESWRSTEVGNIYDVEVDSGYEGTKACMASLTRIQNLGSNGTPDLILFYGGTNDITQRRTVGTFDPAAAPTEVDLTSVKWDTVADAYVAAIMRMQHYYPDAKIVAMLPTYTSKNTDTVIETYNSVFAAICEHYGVTCIDLRDCGISTSDLPDGTHPDAEGMDYITAAVLDVLLTECDMEAEENMVYSISHSLNEVSASLSYYRGVSAGKSFVETITGDHVTVTVTMGGEDITAAAYADGVISIANVTGDIVITATGKEKPIYDESLQQLPENICAGTNLWDALEPENRYYTANGWGNLANGQAWSVTIPLSKGDRIYATSFEAYGTNGNTSSTSSGIRVTFFDANGVLKALTPAETYAQFTANGGYIIAPEGTIAVNIPMWSNDDSNELYILNRDHTYEKGTCTACGVPAWDTDGDGVLEILAIGNSFSVDALEYAYQITQDLGIEEIVLGNLYIGGCTLATHAANAAGDLGKYVYYYNENGTWTSTGSYKISTALASRSWDYVSMQQGSPVSGVESSYNEDLTDLIAYVRERSNAKLVWHMTWAYQQNSTHSAFPTYNKDQMTMYNAIVSAVQNKVATNSDIDLIVPNGTAVQNSRTSLLGDTTTRDGYHMSYVYGRYLTGLLFVKTVTGLSVDDITYAPSGLKAEEKTIAIESVNHAAAKPFEVTQSAYVVEEPEIPDEGYILLKPELHKGAYWYPIDAKNYNTPVADATNSKYYFATIRFNRETLPVGSIIVLENGWQYRPDGWITDTVQSSRADTTTESYVVVTEEWWGDYTIRGFNISKVGTPSLMSLNAEDIYEAFRIYVPEEKHTHGYTSVVTSPTCTQQGYTTHTCILCGDSYADSYLEAAGHSFENSICIVCGELKYIQLQPELYKGAYWHPMKDGRYNELIDDLSNSQNFFATIRFTRETLPVGSIIVLEDGWQYRPDGWITDTLQTGTRESVTTAANVEVTEAWWGDYTIRGFNISKVGLPSLTNVEEEAVRAAFRIYVPENSHVHAYSDGICTLCGAVDSDLLWRIMENGVIVGAYADLQSAVDACSEGSTICLTANCAVTSGVILDKNVTVDGGNFQVDISGCTNAFLTVSEDAAVTIRNLALDGGADGFRVDYDAVTYTDYTIPLKVGTLDNDPKAEQSAIVSSGTLICENVDISNRYTASFGGAMQILAGSAELTDCDFTHNYGTSKGGALYIGSNFATRTEYPVESVSIYGCTFTNNYTGHGGAIYAYNMAQMTVENSQFIGNTANGGKGGAIDLFSETTTPTAAMGLGLDFMQTTVDGCRFEGNWAGNDGFAIQTYDSDLYIYDSEFLENVGVHPTSSVGTVSVEHYRGEDWRIYTLLDGCLFEGNQGPAACYGDHSSPSDLDVTDCIFRSNEGNMSFLLYSAVTNMTDCQFVEETMAVTVVDARIYDNYEISPLLTMTDVSFADCEVPTEILTRKQNHDESLNTYQLVLRGTTNGDITIWDNNAVSILGNHTGNVFLGCTTEEESLTVGENASLNGTVTPNTGHNYVEGVCTVCGKSELFDIAGANLKLGDSLTMFFYVKYEDLEGTDYYAEISKTYADSRGTVVVKIPYDQWTPYSTSMIRMSYEGIAAKEMADAISVVICNGAGQAVSNVWNDSIRNYVDRMIDNQSEKGKTVMADMLNYGAAAQTYFGYNTEDLANSVLTETRQSYATESVTATDGRVLGDNCKGSSVSLKNEILLTIYFENISRDMTARITYMRHNGTAIERTVSSSDFLANGSLLGVVVTGLSVADGMQPVKCEILDGNGNVVAFAQDSVESYLARNMDLSPLFEDTMKFVSAAYNYFH